MKIRLQSRLCALAAAMALTAGAWGAELATKKALTLEVAQGIAAAAHDHAVKNQWNVVITILDDGGNLLYLERMDGTQIGSIQVAIDKAKSAINFKRSSKVFSDIISKGAMGLLTLSGASPIEGGIPIEWEGQAIGSIGVSGVTSQQDGMIAQAGVDALGKIVGN